ncbi:MAG: hypothetical protein HYY50_04805 [Candidatus Kerfeldbacteria bacterium]|nr:hypothetical protein [Candidatus Kerfeldbacteria bacterium]
MHVLFKHGQPGHGVRVICNAVVDHIQVGVGINRRTRAPYPAIDLTYASDVLPTMLAVAGEMEQRRHFPEVYIDLTGDETDVVVLFQLKPVAIDLLATMVPAMIGRHLANRIRDETIEFVTLAEASFRPSDLEPFFRLYGEQSSYRLHLVGNVAGVVGVHWGAQLASFITGQPAPDELTEGEPRLGGDTNG